MNGQFYGCGKGLRGLRRSELALRGGGPAPAASFGYRDACEGTVDCAILTQNPPRISRNLF